MAFIRQSLYFCGCNQSFILIIPSDYPFVTEYRLLVDEDRVWFAKRWILTLARTAFIAMIKRFFGDRICFLGGRGIPSSCINFHEVSSLDPKVVH
jgi:hypothetical protein